VVTVVSDDEGLEMKVTDERRNVALKMVILYSPMSRDMNATRSAEVAAYVVVRAAYTAGSAKTRLE
jgi:hypothetical protein